jgi:hypothetical protein
MSISKIIKIVQVHSLTTNQERQPPSSMELSIKATKMKKMGRVKRMKHSTQNLKSGLNTATLRR